jgi:hypothetical protein
VVVVDVDLADIDIAYSRARIPDIRYTATATRNTNRKGHCWQHLRRTSERRYRPNHPVHPPAPSTQYPVARSTRTRSSVLRVAHATCYMLSRMTGCYAAVHVLLVACTADRAHPQHPAHSTHQTVAAAAAAAATRSTYYILHRMPAFRPGLVDPRPQATHTSYLIPRTSGPCRRTPHRVPRAAAAAAAPPAPRFWSLWPVVCGGGRWSVVASALLRALRAIGPNNQQQPTATATTATLNKQ